MDGRKFLTVTFNWVIIVLTLTIKLPDFIKACLFETSVNGLKFNSV